MRNLITRPKFIISTQHQHILLYFLLVISLLLSSCSRDGHENSFTLTPNPSTEIDNPIYSPTQQPSTAVSQPLEVKITRQPANTHTAIPPQATLSGLDNLPDGYWIFSKSDGYFYHLFVFQPNNLPLTRLTNSPWDDIHPAVSPDGLRVAYASRRNGYMDIYILDLLTSELTRLTDTYAYDGSPSWSPDGKWIAFESYQTGNLDIYIKSVEDPSSPLIQLTSDPSADYSPAWSPLGRQIAYVSVKPGQAEIFLINLDDPNQPHRNISNNALSEDISPEWSSDGQALIWSAVSDQGSWLSEWNYTDNSHPHTLPISGNLPQYKSSSRQILTTTIDPQNSILASYSIQDALLLLPPVAINGHIRGIDWAVTENYDWVADYRSRISQDSPTKLTLSQTAGEPIDLGGKNVLSSIDGTNAPYPYLSDSVDEAFAQLRSESSQQIGWDAFYDLENAFLPISEPAIPGVAEEWFFTGRSFALNSLALQAGWMALVKEEQGGQVYWRVYLRCRYQDGSQGFPLYERIWDLDARYQGDSTAYEEGGQKSIIPTGYWVDFTELAQRFGWRPLPALVNWRSYYPAARFNQFYIPDGLTWQEAMLEIYPYEAYSSTIPTAHPAPSPVPLLTQDNSIIPRPTWTPLPGDVSP